MIQEKIDDLKRAEVALRNTSIVNMTALKHNASRALQLATELIEEMAAQVEKQAACMKAMKKELAEVRQWQIKQ